MFVKQNETQKRFGFTGQGLRINLTTGKITAEPTLPRFADYIGGTSIGYKVLWDEVPPKTNYLDEANKIVIAPGPLTGTGALCSGRTAITTLFATSAPTSLVASSHIGGDIGPMMKFAGWDFFIIEGESKKPVYIYVHNNQVEIRDADFIWGQVTSRAQQELERSHSDNVQTSILTIGPAGENLVPMSVVVNRKSHTGGGIGAVFGKKKLKAIVVQGDQPIHITAKAEEWEKIIDRNRAIIGAHTQTVVPHYPNPLFEYYSPNSRWVGKPGLVYGAAVPPITLTKDMRNLNRIAYRTCSALFFQGESMMKYVVRNNGCYACPIRCYTVMRDVETAGKFNVNPTAEATCMAMTVGAEWFPKLMGRPKASHTAQQAGFVGLQLMNDLGIWCQYGQLQRDFMKMWQEGYWKKGLSEKEYNSINWKAIEDSDVGQLHDILHRIAYREGDFGYWLGEGTVPMLKHFGITEKYWSQDHACLYFGMGHTKHHTNEDDGQVGSVFNMLYNRDPMAHGDVNFTRSGLPIEIQKKIAAKFWGSPDAVDAIGDYKPTNKYKMLRLQWCVARKELHDMLGICSWNAPWEVSPLENEGYVGDIDMESRLFRAVTGRQDSMQDLDDAGLRAFVLERVYTQLQMNTKNMRKDHDYYPEWLFEDPKGRAPFTKGTIRMEKNDIEKSIDLFYEVMGFDLKTGVPTEKCLKKYKLEYCIDALKNAGLM